jgi:hypothetical protein
VKKGVETMQADVYQTFSKSTGEQAKQAMSDATNKFCLHKEQPALPIFGADPNTIRATLQIPPDQGNLTDEVRATTPASLHYVACVTQSTKSEIVKLTKPGAQHTNGHDTWRGAVAGGYFTIERVTNNWDIQLYDLKTDKMVASQFFPGMPPTSWHDIFDYVWGGGYNFQGDLSYVGAAPSLETVSAWVKNYLK